MDRERKRTKEINKVMMSYGRTPPVPTIPSRTTLPGMQVLARSNSTPMTGAVARSMGRCHRGVVVAPIASVRSALPSLGCG